MLPKYRAAIARVSPITRLRVLNYFRLPSLRRSLYDQLDDAGLGQADLVLCLLRLNSRESLRVAERLVGHPITVCPPCLRLRHARLVTRKYVEGERRVRFLKKHNPFLPTCPAFQRWRMLRDGMLVSEYRARGGRKRDLRRAAARGVVTLEKVA